MTSHSETLALQEAPGGDLAEAILGGARIYLQFGSAPMPELLRVLGQHLCELTGRGGIEAVLHELITAGLLVARGSQVSLPAGGDPRDAKERDDDR